MAIPDRGRGERVNVGIIVFLEDRLDIRVSEISKVRALTGQDWSEYAKDMAHGLNLKFTNGEHALNEIGKFPRIDSVFEASSVAWFSIHSVAEYEGRVQEILDALVVRPKLIEKKVKASRINTEISKHFRKFKVLARRDEAMESHKVVRDYFIEDELQADFAQMNGVLRVAATLDLRRPHHDIRDTALKAIVLDRAKETKGDSIVRVGIYASHVPDASDVRSHIKVLHDYSDKLYNWEDARERGNLMNFIFEGLRISGPLV